MGWYMANSFFQFKQFTIHQDKCAMKVTTDACLFGAWVARELKAQQHSIRNIIDIGTGTGLLTLMVAQKNSGLEIDAIEIEKNAFEQAKENINGAGFKNKICLWNDNILREQYFRRYDTIISNPPFYENEIRSKDNLKNIAHHDEGLPLEKLLPVIKNMMHAPSRFYLLLPYKRSKEIETLFQRNQLCPTKIVSVRQSVNHSYFRLMIEGSLFKDYEALESEIAICESDGQYTSDFIKLLKDYYLNL